MIEVDAAARSGNGWGFDGLDVQAATSKRGGLNYLNTHGIRRTMPFSVWDTDKDGLLTDADVATLTAQSDAAGDPKSSDWAELLAFMDVGWQGSTWKHAPDGKAVIVNDAAGDGVVTLLEYETTMDGVKDGTRLDPGWLRDIDALALEIANTRAHDKELLVVSACMGGNWPRNAIPSPGIRHVAHALIDAGVDIIHGNPHDCS